MAIAGDDIWHEVDSRMGEWIRNADLICEMGPEELVRNGICDPVKVFVKEEPHSMKKIVEGKLRIIASVSIVFQLMTRVICAKQNKAEIRQWESCPSKPGLGLHDEGLRVIVQNAKDILAYGSILETDVSGWDWSCQDWELALDAKIRLALSGQLPGSDFDKVLRVHAHCVSNSVFVLSNGEMFAQTIAGGQLSGDYNTSSTNSRMRVAASLLARKWSTGTMLLDGKMLVVAMGDDSFELDVPGVSEGLKAIGHTVKMEKRDESVDDLAFCSHLYHEDGTAWPEDYTKTLTRYLSHKRGDESYPAYLAQLMHVMRHYPSSESKDKFVRVAMGRVERPENEL